MLEELDHRVGMVAMAALVAAVVLSGLGFYLAIEAEKTAEISARQADQMTVAYNEYVLSQISKQAAYNSACIERADEILAQAEAERAATETAIAAVIGPLRFHHQYEEGATLEELF
jgi:cell division protein FtsN